MTFHRGAHWIITVGLPTAADAPHRQVSPTRRAGRPDIIAVELPIGNGLTVGTWPGGGIGQTCKSPTTAAGLPPIITVGTPSHDRSAVVADVADRLLLASRSPS